MRQAAETQHRRELHEYELHSEVMESFSDRLLRKRAALLRSIPKADKRRDDGNETRKRVALERVTDRSNLTAAVHRSVKQLIKLGFTFSQIIEGSGVSEAFLRQAYRELSLGLPNEPEQPQGDSNSTGYPAPRCTVPKKENSLSPSPEGSHQRTEKGTTRKIEPELRLFMLKMRLEINRLRSLAKQPELAEQLKQDDAQSAIQKLKDTIYSNLHEFFNEVEVVHSTQDDEPSKRAQDVVDLTLERSPKKAKTRRTHEIELEPTAKENLEPGQRTDPSMVCNLVHSWVSANY